MDPNSLRCKRIELSQRSKKTLQNIAAIEQESFRVAGVAHNAKHILDNLDEEFERQTCLNRLDVSFLFFATALQCIRQYVLTSFKERVDDKTGAKDTQKPDEHSNRNHRWYRPSLKDIITNPVPFDAIYGSPNFDLNIGGGFNHRARTLGHDPILGWVFGTMNILTSTLTTSDFLSFHVRTNAIATGAVRDKITHQANMSKILFYSEKRLFNEGIEGKQAVGIAICKEAIHLRSDINTYASLPIPIVSTISPDLARTLADYGLDAANVVAVGKQASYATLINAIIAMIHTLLYDEFTSSSRRIHEVKTRKILSYSNLIASISNILYTAITKDVSKFDVGGILVTIYRLVNDAEFISRIKEEFIFNSFSGMIRGTDYNFE